MVERILRLTGRDLQVTFFVDEVPTDADGSVTVTIVGENGTTVVPTTTADRVTTGVYRYSLDPQATLDHFTITWTGTFDGTVMSQVTNAEIVGGYWAPLSELRAQPDLSDTSTYTTAKLSDARTEAEDLFERYIGRAFVRRYARDVVDGDGYDTIRLTQRPLRSLIDVTTDGSVATTNTWYVYPEGTVTRDTGTFTNARRRNVIVRYEHGFDAPPSDLRRVFVDFVRYKLLEASKAITERALSFTNEYGNVQMAVAGPDRPTGIPHIDAVLNQYRDLYRVPAIA